MAKIVPATAPDVNVLLTQPGEPVLATDYKGVFELQNFLLSQEGSRITGLVFDPQKDIIGQAGYTSVGWFELRPLRTQGGINSFFYTVTVNGFNYDMRARFYSTNGTFQDVILVSFPTDPPQNKSVEIQLTQPVDVYRVDIQFRYQDVGVGNAYIQQVNVAASPLDPAREW
jgi:hypothetical protein